MIMLNKNQQCGNLLVIAAVIIVVIAALSSGIVHMFSAKTQGFDVNSNQEAKAVLAAISAGEWTARNALHNPTLASRTYCNNISGLTFPTLPNYPTMVFSATGQESHAHPRSGQQPAVLWPNDIDATTTNISLWVYSDSPMPPDSGRVYIDREAIEYDKLNCVTIEGDQLCGLLNAKRGRAGTTATSHSRMNYAGYYSCALTSNAGLPNLTSSDAVTAQTQHNVALENIWAVGKDQSFIEWNNNSSDYNWIASAQAGSVINSDYNGVSFVNNALGWAVGDRISNSEFNIVKTNRTGSAWANESAPCINCAEDLNAVVAVNQRSAWAVGDRDNGSTFTILHYTSTDAMQPHSGSWCRLDSPGPSCNNHTITFTGNARDLFGVDVIEMSNGVSVGFAVGDRATILSYSSATSSWTRYNWQNPQPTYDINAVKAIPPAAGSNSLLQAWAAADGGRILQYTPTSWSVVHDSGGNLNAIFMLHNSKSEYPHDGYAHEGWAVGDSGNIIHIERTSVSAPPTYTYTTQTNPSNENLNGVYFNTADDGWAVGNNDTILHWDGSAWTSVTSPLSGSPGLKAISGTGGNQLLINIVRNTG